MTTLSSLMGNTFTNTPAEIDDATDAVQLAKAEEATDITVGRLLKVGDFGLGKSGFGGATVDMDTLTTVGFYSVAVDSTNKPPAHGAYVGAVYMRDPGSRLVQHFYLMGQAVQRSYFRERLSTGAWSSWHEFYHSGNTIVDGSGFIKEA